MMPASVFERRRLRLSTLFKYVRSRPKARGRPNARPNFQQNSGGAGALIAPASTAPHSPTPHPILCGDCPASELSVEDLLKRYRAGCERSPRVKEAPLRGNHDGPHVGGANQATLGPSLSRTCLAFTRRGSDMSAVPDGETCRGAIIQPASCRALASALLPACPKPPPFLEVFVCDADSPVARQVSDILRRTGGTPKFFA